MGLPAGCSPCRTGRGRLAVRTIQENGRHGHLQEEGTNTATIQKTYTTSLEAVTVLEDSGEGLESRSGTRQIRATWRPG